MSTLWAFPGQGAQQPGMLQALPDAAVVHDCLEQASATLGEDVRLLDSAEALEGTRAVQLCLLIAGVAASRLLIERGHRPEYVAGLSIGAYAAAVVAEALDFADALRLVALVQPSSTDVERLFSQLKLILEQVGVSGLEESYETRTMTRVNVF